MSKSVLKLDDFGRGIIKEDGKIIFIPFATVGDEIEYIIEKDYKNYSEGKLTNIINKSPYRVDAPCPFFGKCGGCSIENISYDNGLNFKSENVITEYLKNGIKIDPEIIKNENYFSYRNKITLKINNKIIGFYENNSNSIVEVDKCIIASEAINRVFDFVKSIGIINGEVTIRSNYNNEVLIIIDTKDNIKVINIPSYVVGVVINSKCIYGNDYFYDEINGIKYKVSYNSFFQVNPFVTSKLFNIINDNIAVKSKVLDLYCGVGAISLNVANKAKEVLGIEIVDNAILNAEENSKLNKIKNSNFICSDVVKSLSEINNDYDTLILDPPRKGLDKKVINKILECSFNKIIYVSCDYHTQIRDFNLLKEKYDIKKSYIFDMFSFTYHVETVLVLERK